MSDLIYVKQDDAGPLCPCYDAPEHLQHVKVLNALYDQMPRDADGEYNEEGHQAIYQAAHDAIPDRMNLYRIQTTPAHDSLAKSVALNGGYVEAWYFQCPTCRFTVPATQRNY